jgi:hypothetical protein
MRRMAQLHRVYGCPRDQRPCMHMRMCMRPTRRPVTAATAGASPGCLKPLGTGRRRRGLAPSTPSSGLPGRARRGLRPCGSESPLTSPFTRPPDLTRLLRLDFNSPLSTSYRNQSCASNPSSSTSAPAGTCSAARPSPTLQFICAWAAWRGSRKTS